MAQLNITLSQEEILLLMSQDREGAFKKLLQESLNQIMQAESAEQLKAQPYERSSDRVDSRNGSYTRELTTRIGTITLTVPRHRNVPFKTMVFDNYSTSEAALITTMAEMVVNGVATRKVGKVMEDLCGRNFSKSTVSETCKELDKDVERFRNRLLTEEYPFVTVDATYFSVREDHKVIKKALFIAYAVNSQGKRDILGFASYPSETKETWKDFFQWLKNKGLSGVKMFVSDAHDGIRYGISQVFPFVPWQRCQHHFLKNIVQKVPLKYQKGLSSELTEMFNSKTVEEARRIKDDIINDYRDIAEEAMNCLDEGFEFSMTIMVLPEKLRKQFRTSNHIERLNYELKRRSKAIGIFPNEASMLRLMGAVLMEYNELIQSRKHLVFYQTTYAQLMACSKKLEKLAEEHRGIMVA